MKGFQALEIKKKPIKKKQVKTSNNYLKTKEGVARTHNCDSGAPSKRTTLTGQMKCCRDNATDEC